MVTDMSPKLRSAKRIGDRKLLADSILDDHRLSLPVAMCGYRWVSVGKTRVLTDCSDDGSEQPESKTYSPVSEHGLFKKFATLEPTEIAFTEFANHYGVLGLEAVSLDAKRIGEAWGDWLEAQLQMSIANHLWDAIQAEDVSGIIRCTRTKNWTVWAIEGSVLGKQFHVQLAFNEHNPLAAAKRFIQAFVNDGLDGHTLVRTVFHERRRAYVVRIFPRTLLGSMWWQLGRAFTGQVQIGECKVCRKPLEHGPNGFMATREFCSPACKQKDHREKVKRAKELHAQGATERAIAKALYTNAETIRHWLTKPK